MSDNEEKPLELRDKLMIEVLNGYIANSDRAVKDIRQIDDPDYCDDMDLIIRHCYKVADIIRKVRLTSFE